MEDPDNSSSITFELNLNIKKYGEFLANNILEKYLENYDLEENQLKKDFKKHMKGLFHIIFREINKFENIPLNSKIINDMGYLKDVETPLNFTSKISRYIIKI